MTKHVSVNAILAIGVTFVILTGGIDLSVGSIAGWPAWSPGSSFSGWGISNGGPGSPTALVILIGSRSAPAWARSMG